jgi:hypothetical protein
MYARTARMWFIGRDFGKLGRDKNTRANARSENRSGVSSNVFDESWYDFGATPTQVFNNLGGLST